MDAGPFGAWLAAARALLRGEGVGIDVPCGDCAGCCTSSLFVHVRPEESATLAVIPKQLLVRAPGRPRGHMLLGFAEDGSCPMYQSRACSIYAQRPRTCRDYDCRIFAAAGIDAGDGHDAINERVRAWAFTYESGAEARAHAAVRRAAAFIRDERESFPGGVAPTSPGQIAVLALKVYQLFLNPRAAAAVDTAAALVEACRQFDGTPIERCEDRPSRTQKPAAPPSLR